MKLRTLSAWGVPLAVIVGVWWLRAPAEPVYLGQPISYWIEPWQHHGTEPEDRIEAAFSAMDERAVRWLSGQLDWRPSRLKATLNKLVARVISARFFNDRPDRREVAAIGLGRLGPRAASAVPALERVWRAAAEPRSGGARSAALGALIRIRHEPLEPYVDLLRDPSGPDWHLVACAMWHLGTNAAPAVPHLVRALEGSPSEWTRHTAVSTLASIHSRPELTVPALTRQLDHASMQVRWNAVRGLGLLGEAAKPACPHLRARAQDPELPVRVAATNALRLIDPESARRLGRE